MNPQTTGSENINLQTTGGRSLQTTGDNLQTKGDKGASRSQGERMSHQTAGGGGQSKLQTTGGKMMSPQTAGE